jgi:DNA-binding GntR family transcriptional regulator
MDSIIDIQYHFPGKLNMQIPLPRSHEDRGLSNWVISSLRDAILNGYFQPGEKLDQSMIASELNVSRTPIREALKVLVLEGFVEIHAYKGAFIPRISRQELRDIYEIRWVIEQEIIRQAVPVIPDEVLKELQEKVILDGEDTDSGADGKHFEADREFHGTIANYCQNKLFKEILDNLNNRIVRVRSFALRQPGSHHTLSHNEHLAILKALSLRDPERAVQLMGEHLKNSSARIEKFIVE